MTPYQANSNAVGQFVVAQQDMIGNSEKRLIKHLEMLSFNSTTAEVNSNLIHVTQQGGNHIMSAEEKHLPAAR